MPTLQIRIQPSTVSDRCGSDVRASLPERRRRWIRLADVSEVDSEKRAEAYYQYDMYGQPTQTVGSLASDFQYAGYYFHAPSGLNLTTFRAYNPSLGRWINRDPAGESGGTNLYDYAFNKPASVIDPSGLIPYAISTQAVANAFGLPNNFPGGCFDVINGLTGNPLGTRPDDLPSTKCFYGPSAFAAASAAAKQCCNGGVIWSKNSSAWTLGSPPAVGPVNPNVVAGALGDVDYVTFNSVNGYFYDLTGGGQAGGHVYAGQPWAPAQVWCSTCKNMPSNTPAPRPIGH